MKNFPGGTWTIYVVQGGTPHMAGTVAGPCSSAGCTNHFATPLGVLVGQSDFVEACLGSRCYYSGTVTVGL
jgi:hypothetical protein